MRRVLEEIDKMTPTDIEAVTARLRAVTMGAFEYHPGRDALEQALTTVLPDYWRVHELATDLVNVLAAAGWELSRKASDA
jgi:hypothetical protein